MFVVSEIDVIKSLIRYVAIGSVVVLTACGTSKPKPESVDLPVAKPAISKPEPKPEYSSASTFNAINWARISLEKNKPDTAVKALKEAKGYLEHFNNKLANESDLLAELTYANNGNVTQLYAPLYRGSERYGQMKKLLKALKRVNITPYDFRLVYYTRVIHEEIVPKYFDAALDAIQKESTAAEHSKGAMVDRELQKFYKELYIQTYQGEPENRLEFHSDASVILMKAGAYEAAQDALAFAEQALIDLRLSQKDPGMVEQYEWRLENLKKAIKAKNPSLFERLSRVVVGQLMD